ncbi:hypothetical protein ACNF49_33515 [Actinomadura sp. ATCC 39365]
MAAYRSSASTRATTASSLLSSALVRGSATAATSGALSPARVCRCLARRPDSLASRRAISHSWAGSITALRTSSSSPSRLTRDCDTVATARWARRSSLREDSSRSSRSTYRPSCRTAWACTRRSCSASSPSGVSVRTNVTIISGMARSTSNSGPRERPSPPAPSSRPRQTVAPQTAPSRQYGAAGRPGASGTQPLRVLSSSRRLSLSSRASAGGTPGSTITSAMMSDRMGIHLLRGRFRGQLSR